MPSRVRWRRAWWLGFLAAPCVWAGATGDRVEWLALLGAALWVGSLLYLLLRDGIWE